MLAKQKFKGQQGKAYPFSRFCLCVCALCVGFSWTGYLATQRASQQIMPALEQQNIQVVGTISALPHLQTGRWRFILHVEEAYTQDGKAVRLPEQILLNWYFQQDVPDHTSPPALHAGQRWTFQVRLKAPHGGANHLIFDYELWLWTQKIGAVGYVRTAKDSPEPVLLDGSSFSGGMQAWRDWVREQISREIPEPRLSGFIAALTMGDQRAVEQTDWDTFRITGIAHLVSISGLHITMMAWIAYGLFAWCWRRSTRLMLWIPAHTAAIIIGMMTAIFYAWFAGWGIPAQRTVLMLATIVFLKIVGVRWPWYSVWLLIAVVVIACDPWALMQAGFWLSFIAVGVLFLQPSPNTSSQPHSHHATLLFISPSYPWWHKTWLWLWRQTKNLFVIQLCISVALAPLTLLLFQEISVVGIIVNLFAIPWVTFVLVPLCILGVFCPLLWQGAAWAARILLCVLEWFANMPFAQISHPVPPLWWGILSIIGAVVAVLPGFKWPFRLASVCVAASILLWQPEKPPAGEFEAIFLDVGQGNAVLIRTQNHALLYDAGPRYSEHSDAGSLLIIPFLKAIDIYPDRIVLSHADNDHIGGINTIVNSYPHTDLLISAPLEHPLWQAPASALYNCTAGMSWKWDDVHFDILYPFEPVVNANQARNEQSCVLRISTKATGNQSGVTVLLTGDIEARQEMLLTQTTQDMGTSLQADVLLVPHHGSKTSSSLVFLEHVKPRWAIVQAGYLNHYGHPAPDVVRRYQQQQIQLISTVSCGAATWRSQDPQQMQCERIARPRYWQHQQIQDRLHIP